MAKHLVGKIDDLEVDTMRKVTGYCGFCAGSNS